MSQLLITQARVFDGTHADCAEGMNVLVADGLIQQVSAQPITAPNARVIDASSGATVAGPLEFDFVVGDLTFSPDHSVAVVTGGSRGIGRALAAALRQAGAEVVISGRSQQKLDRTAKEIDVVPVAGAREAGVEIGGQLYSDSMGSPGEAGETYIGMLRENVVTIVTHLK